MKKRRTLRVEQLENRLTPDVSIGHAAAPDLQAFHANLPNAEQLPVIADMPLSATTGTPDQVTRTAGLPETAILAQYLHTLEKIFSDPVEREKILARHPLPHQFGESASIEDLVPLGWQFLCNYTRKAIRNDAQRFGRPPDQEEIIQQIFVEWSEQVGASAQSLSNLLDKSSAERQVLRKTVRRVLDHARYEQNRDSRTLQLIDQAAPADPAEQDWRDLQIDLAQGVGRLDAQSRKLLELRSYGKTFEEIGVELGLRKQRVFEIYSAAIDRLQTIYQI
jgi:RNA polymerase sigma factor (sigma-70 family)